jgi:hypothetical protein
LKVNYRGCAICDSTWGDLWEEVGGERLFFCCSICAAQFRALFARLRQETGWSEVDALEIEGDRTGRRVTAHRGADRREFSVIFTPQGEILRWRALGVGPARVPPA